jgi:hypothetical protein
LFVLNDACPRPTRTDISIVRQNVKKKMEKKGDRKTQPHTYTELPSGGNPQVEAEIGF